jgi:hypothetical protein
MVLRIETGATRDTCHPTTHVSQSSGAQAGAHTALEHRVPDLALRSDDVRGASAVFAMRQRPQVTGH